MRSKEPRFCLSWLLNPGKVENTAAAAAAAANMVIRGVADVKPCSCSVEK